MALEGLLCLAAAGIAAGGVAALLGSQDRDDQRRRGPHPHYLQAYLDASLFLDHRRQRQRQPRRQHPRHRSRNEEDEDNNLFSLPPDDREQRLWAFRRYILAHEPSRQPPPPPPPSPRYHRAPGARPIRIHPHRQAGGESTEEVAVEPASLPHIVRLSEEEGEEMQPQQQQKGEEEEEEEVREEQQQYHHHHQQPQQQQSQHPQGRGGGGGSAPTVTTLPPLPVLPRRRQQRTAASVAPPAPTNAMVGMLRQAQERNHQPPPRVKIYHALGKHLTVFQMSPSSSFSSKNQGPHRPPTPHSGPRLSRLMLAVFASRRATVDRLLRTGTEEIEARDARGRTVLWWACRWGETAMVRLLLRAGACEKARDCDGSTPRDATKMGPAARVCLGLLKEAERANLLWKVRVLKEKEQEAAEVAEGSGWGGGGKDGYLEGIDDDADGYDELLFDDRFSWGVPWPVVTLRSVPSPRGCWWIPGGRGSSSSSSSSGGGMSTTVKMNKVPRDVRAAVLEHVVGCGSGRGGGGGGGGLSDDVFVELRHMLL